MAKLFEILETMSIIFALRNRHHKLMLHLIFFSMAWQALIFRNVENNMMDFLLAVPILSLLLSVWKTMKLTSDIIWAF